MIIKNYELKTGHLEHTQEKHTFNSMFINNGQKRFNQ